MNKTINWLNSALANCLVKSYKGLTVARSLAYCVLSKAKPYQLWKGFYFLKEEIYLKQSINCDWIWQSMALTHRSTFGEMMILSDNCIIAFWYIMLKKWNLQQVLVYSLAITVWVNYFQTIKNSSCFLRGLWFCTW